MKPACRMNYKVSHVKSIQKLLVIPFLENFDYVAGSKVTNYLYFQYNGAILLYSEKM